MSQADFDGWVRKTRDDGGTLAKADYRRLAQPSEREPVHRYAGVDPDLYAAILNQAMHP
jgi:cytochrome o ubiquinol oxidase subunit 2